MRDNPFLIFDREGDINDQIQTPKRCMYLINLRTYLLRVELDSSPLAKPLAMVLKACLTEVSTYLHLSRKLIACHLNHRHPFFTFATGCGSYHMFSNDEKSVRRFFLFPHTVPNVPSRWHLVFRPFFINKSGNKRYECVLLKKLKLKSNN